MNEHNNSRNGCDECRGSTSGHARAEGSVARKDGGGYPDDGHPKRESGSSIAGDCKAVAACAYPMSTNPAMVGVT